MGKIDTEAKRYFSDNARFADAFNYLIYDGRPVIEPGSLTPLDPAEIVVPYGNEAREPLQKFRDLLKRWQVKTDGSAVYAVLGAELQSAVSYAMPVRSGLYDFMHYAKQVEEAARSYRKEQKTPLTRGEFLAGFRREDRLIPVITLVIFLGDAEWDGPVRIREMFAGTEERLLSFVPDYKTNLITPYGMEKEDFYKFRTDVGQLLEYIKNQKDKDRIDEMVHDGDRFRRLDVETADLINTVTGSGLRFEAKEDKVDMCKAIEDMRNDSRNEGRLEGRAEGIDTSRLESIQNVMSGLKYTAQQAMDLLRIPADDRERYLARL